MGRGTPSNGWNRWRRLVRKFSLRPTAGWRWKLYCEARQPAGNGPNMAAALGKAGLNLRYIGALGEGTAHPVFEPLAEQTEAIAVADPGVIQALEFGDGTVKLGEMASLGAIDYRNILRHMTEGAFFDLLSRQDLVCAVNWAATPRLTTLLTDLLDYVIPNLPPRELKHYFFALSDPDKRSDGEVRSVLSTIARFQNWGAVCLGLRAKEAERVARVLGQSMPAEDARGLKSVAASIRTKLNVGTVVVQGGEAAACATKLESAGAAVGSGGGRGGGVEDAFYAGFCVAQLLDFPLAACLTTAVGFRSYHAERGRSPSLSEAQGWLRR